MALRALIVGGTGQLGTATAAALLAAGYETTLASRRGTDASRLPDARLILLDREDTSALRAAAEGMDLVVDTVAFGPEHAAQLGSLAGRIGSLVVISTGSVYLGENGLSYDDARDGFSYPRFPVPITERQPTIPSRGDGYGARKAQLERELLETAGLATSILRPGSVHGPHSAKIREWAFLKRALDRRPHLFLARGGRQRFATSATANVAALVLACARHPATRVLNAVDDESLTMSEVVRLALDAVGTEAEIITFDGPPKGGVGATPWDAPVDFVCSMDEARRELGYRAVMDYATALHADLDWILSERAARAARGEDPDGLFPDAESWFPYDAEDRAVREGIRG